MSNVEVTYHNRSITIPGKEVADKIQHLLDTVIKEVHQNPNVFNEGMKNLYLDGILRGLQLAGVSAQNWTEVPNPSEEV